MALVAQLVENLVPIECRMLWVRVPPEAAHFSLKMTVLVELHCVVLWESLGLNISYNIWSTLQMSVHMYFQIFNTEHSNQLHLRNNG